jgi:hypothetical protein
MKSFEPQRTQKNTPPMETDQLILRGSIPAPCMGRARVGLYARNFPVPTSDADRVRRLIRIRRVHPLERFNLGDLCDHLF